MFFIRLDLEREKLQRDLCLCKEAGLTYTYMLSLFTVLRLAQLSLLSPSGECAPDVVTLENRSSETRLRDPTASAGSS